MTRSQLIASLIALKTLYLGEAWAQEQIQAQINHPGGLVQLARDVALWLFTNNAVDRTNIDQIRVSEYLYRLQEDGYYTFEQE